MKCVVINGTEIRGCTYHLKELFLDELKPEALTEFYLPKDAPGYCIGCKRCFLESEAFCPHFEKVDPIWRAMKEADLLVCVACAGAVEESAGSSGGSLVCASAGSCDVFEVGCDHHAEYRGSEWGCAEGCDDELAVAGGGFCGADRVWVDGGRALG